MFDERSLVKALINLDDRAFDYLVDRYGDDILRFCYIKTSDISIAEDLTQETLINIFKNIGNFKFKSSLKTWIYKIALNVCREYFRAKKQLSYLEDDKVSKVLIDEEFNIEEEILNKIDNELIAEKLCEINPKYRDVIYMFYYKDFAIKDIGIVLGEKENTIKTRLRRGKIELGKLLVEEGIYGQT